ncbi:PREDICTED: 3-ketoacyl-CoA synthase 11-like [Populus euphratica]|uniref:3-ketoacyl-CoA synthase 11-like n=1 Tax=Populus euphratica TaxID=75702 RepID=A0AAJ6UBS1_POPEU|nr:PREDICTED: 3-ketoacyl-CoA synthase 11-like [Populus euphratica]
MWSKELVIERARQTCTNLPEETMVFMEKLSEKSGLGPSTYLPEAFRRDPPHDCLEEARKESEMVIFGAVEDLLAKTGVKVVPSLSAMIVNRYKLGDKVASYNISGMAILLSNKPSDSHVTKHQLIHAVRPNTAASDSSYNCFTRLEDSQGLLGITTTKDLIQEAIKTIETNLTTLGHLVLPISEKIQFIANYIARHFRARGKGQTWRKTRSKTDMEASRMTLYWFDNAASSSVWSGLAYAKAKGRIKKGGRVWQISFGSGFMCNSLIMKATRAVDRDEKNPWSGEIDEFPVDLKSTEGGIPYEFKPSKKI